MKNENIITINKKELDNMIKILNDCKENITKVSITQNSTGIGLSTWLSYSYTYTFKGADISLANFHDITDYSSW